MKHSGHPVKYLTLAAMMAALTVITTVYLLHIHLPALGGQGCFHLGDTIIYLGASFLPTPYACAAAAIGGSLADLLCGSPIWLPWTFFIKAGIAFFFSAKSKAILTKRNILALLGAFLLTVGGYYIAEGFIYGNWITPIYSMIGNSIQSFASAVLYIVLALLLDKIKIKKQLGL